MALSADELRNLLGELYQTIAAVVDGIEHADPGVGNAHDATLLDILSDPDELPFDEVREKLVAIRDYYWKNPVTPRGDAGGVA